MTEKLNEKNENELISFWHLLNILKLLNEMRFISVVKLTWKIVCDKFNSSLSLMFCLISNFASLFFVGANEFSFCSFINWRICLARKNSASVISNCSWCKCETRKGFFVPHFLPLFHFCLLVFYITSFVFQSLIFFLFIFWGRKNANECLSPKRQYSREVESIYITVNQNCNYKIWYFVCSFVYALLLLYRCLTRECIRAQK